MRAVIVTCAQLRSLFGSRQLGHEPVSHQRRPGVRLGLSRQLPQEGLDQLSVVNDQKSPVSGHGSEVSGKGSEVSGQGSEVIGQVVRHQTSVVMEITIYSQVDHNLSIL